MYSVRATITLRPSILDPQGKASLHALNQLGFAAIKNVRIGKSIQMMIDAGSEQEARDLASEACRQLLANPVMEDFDIEIDEVAHASA